MAWVRLERWQRLTPAEQDSFPPLCPDFVIELRSKTDRLAPLQAKLREYQANGCQLGWLINGQDRQVEVYRAEQPPEILDAPLTLSGEALLPGLIVNTLELW
ncbi:hypothetical protein GFS31_17990 [Leptolyngbya sp. BL0902]|nr:hypothetical protein GFS31_17990 [Leptolyngbya sp. BL0902]